MRKEDKGGFTLPGEAGYEELTLKLAEKWGADVIRDSDGTRLSEEILSAGYGIYSTICIIRDHNEWAKQNLDKRQQTFLITEPVVATKDSVGLYFGRTSRRDKRDSAISQLYGQLFGISDMGRNFHVQSCDQRLAKRTFDADRSKISTGAGVYDAVVKRLVLQS